MVLAINYQPKVSWSVLGVLVWWCLLSPNLPCLCFWHEKRGRGLLIYPPDPPMPSTAGKPSLTWCASSAGYDGLPPGMGGKAGH